MAVDALTLQRSLAHSVHVYDVQAMAVVGTFPTLTTRGLPPQPTSPFAASHFAANSTIRPHLSREPARSPLRSPPVSLLHHWPLVDELVLLEQRNATSNVPATQWSTGTAIVLRSPQSIAARAQPIRYQL